MSTPQDLKTAGLKATLPRLKIINLFEQSTVRHLTAEDVYWGAQLGLAEMIEAGVTTATWRRSCWHASTGWGMNRSAPSRSPSKWIARC